MTPSAVRDGGRGADRGPAQADGARRPARGCRPQSPGGRLRDPGGLRRGLRGSRSPAGRSAATALETQRLFGVEEPFYGPILAPRGVRARRPSCRRRDFPLRGIECEFAFRLAADFEPREEPYELDEAAERVSAPIPAIEIVSPRLDHPIKYGAPSAIADCGVNGALVLGAADLDWQSIDLATHEVRLEIDGEPKAAGTGALVLGHPLNVLAWFVNRYTAGGRTLPAGQIVSTGTTTGLVILEPGQTAVADFGILGQVSLRFSA